MKALSAAVEEQHAREIRAHVACHALHSAYMEKSKALDSSLLDWEDRLVARGEEDAASIARLEAAAEKDRPVTCVFASDLSPPLLPTLGSHWTPLEWSRELLKKI